MQKSARVLLIDVGSSSIGVGVAEKGSGGMPVLSHVARTPLMNASGGNAGALQTLALDALKKSLDGLKAVSPAPREAHVVLAAPWYKGTITVINSESGKTLKIAEGTVEKTLRDYRENQAEHSSPERTKMELSVSQAYVNGYPTNLSKPIHGTSLSLSIYESEADTAFLKSIEEAVRSAFAGSTTTFHSFSYAAFSVIRSLRDEENFAVIDVGGEITDIAMANRDSLFFTGSFPVGAFSVPRAIAGAGGSMADATSRASLFVRGELSAEESLTFGSVFETAAAPWRGGYKKILEIAASDTPLPHTTFLMADKEELNWFASILTPEDLALPARPILVLPDFLNPAITLGTEGKYDPFLAIGALHTLGVVRGLPPHQSS